VPLGLVLNAVLGWWRADPAAGYVLVFYAAREVREIFSRPGWPLPVMGGHAQRGMLDDAAGYGDTDADQDQAADEFAALAGAGADPVAQLQADQRHTDADGADHDSR
jgi:hypothetical protein